jgi:hypothetical protein
MYASLLGISGALYLAVFEQPAGRTLFQQPAEISGKISGGDP